MAYPADAMRFERVSLMKRISQSSVNMPVPQSLLAPGPVTTRVDAKVRQLEGSLQRIAEPLTGDHESWLRNIQEALGTTSPHFAETCHSQHGPVCRLGFDPEPCA